MSGPWDDYAAPAEEPSAAGPWAEYAEPQAAPTSERVASRRKDRGVGRKLDAAVRGAADMLSFGFADEISAGLNSLPALAPGGETYSEAFDRNVADERAIDAADREDMPVSRGIGQGVGLLGGLALGAVAAPARAGGSLVGNALRGAAEGAAYGGLAAAGEAEGGIGERAVKAIPGAALGAGLGAALAPVGHAVGAGINALRPGSREAIDRAAQALRGRFDVGAARTRANALRDAGAVPTAVSAMDESGRGYVRAAASRMTPGREVVQQRAEAAALNLPDRISSQARAHISDTPRSADDVVDALEELRGETARTTYAEPYSERIALNPRVASALSGREGQQAIEAAIRTAEARRDFAALADLRVLQRATREGLPEAQVTLGVASEAPPMPTVSGAALDRVQIELGQRARNLTRSVENPNPALAAGVSGRQRDVNRVLDDTEGLREARSTFAAQTRNIEAAEAADRFMRPGSADDFGQVLGAADDLDPARMVAARAVERAAGENVSAAPGVARRLADAPEQQARNRALLGEEGAQRFEEGMRAEARTVRDLQDVAPRTGSQTQLRTADQETVNGVANMVATAMGGRRAIAVAFLNRLKTAGLSDADAEAVARIATDPAQLDDLLQRMERMAPGSSQQLLRTLNQAAGRQIGEATQPHPSVEAFIESVPDAYGASYGPAGN